MTSQEPDGKSPFLDEYTEVRNLIDKIIEAMIACSARAEWSEKQLQQVSHDIDADGGNSPATKRMKPNARSTYLRLFGFGQNAQLYLVGDKGDPSRPRQPIKLKHVDLIRRALWKLDIRQDENCGDTPDAWQLFLKRAYQAIDETKRGKEYFVPLPAGKLPFGLGEKRKATSNPEPESPLPQEPDASAEETSSSGPLSPYPPTYLGREAEVSGIAAEIVNDGAMVLVFGEMGIGKTIVTEAAAFHPATVEKFGDRRWFVRLQGVTRAADVLLMIGEAIDPFHPVAANRWLFDHLGAGPALLILDNLETPLHAERSAMDSLLQKMSAVPGLSVLCSIRGDDPLYLPRGLHDVRAATDTNSE